MTRLATSISALNNKSKKNSIIGYISISKFKTLVIYAPIYDVKTTSILHKTPIIDKSINNTINQCSMLPIFFAL